MDYKEEDFLQLSGLQHFLYCRRQWALIHIEQQWEENYRTVDGRLMHENAHNSSLHTRRGTVLTVRAMRLHSARLGLSGECDVVEFHQNPKGIRLAQAEGLWLPYPVEYKRGEPKADSFDEAQLCAQAMCLEEMLCCEVPTGALYYGKVRRRQTVDFTDELRAQVCQAAEEMHELYRRGYTPKAKPKKGCNACSLRELCIPRLIRTPSVMSYLHGGIEDGK